MKSKKLSNGLKIISWNINGIRAVIKKGFLDFLKKKKPDILCLQEIDMIRKSGFRPQIVGCFLNDKKILFLFKKKHELWQLPQGGIDNHETIGQATIREMTEELGKKFLSSMNAGALIGDNIVEFPNYAKNSRELKTDDGKERFMKGKKYFFIMINTNITDLNIEQTEFNDYKWLNYEDSLKLSDTIYQKGKQRITVDILNKLHNLNLL